MPERLLTLLLIMMLAACGSGGNDAPPPDGPGTGTPGDDNGDDDPPVFADGAYFKHDMPWQRDVSGDATHPDSDAIIDYMITRAAAGELFPRTDGVMQIDFTSFHILHAGDTTRRVPYDENLEMAFGSWYGDPPCDNLVEVPLPEGGRMEGVADYHCAETLEEDCHLIVHDTDNEVLYEFQHASLFDDEGAVGAVCPVAWDLEYAYGDTLRGQNCTSADAAGLPIAPLLVTADEIAAGEIRHALRFILRNDVMRRGLHVAPATHSGGPTAEDQYAPLYGMRFRLRADYPVETLSRSGQVIARAMQRYGLIVADGGNLPFTFLADAYTQHKWSEFDDFGPRMFEGVLDISDFEIVASGPAVDSTQDCELGIDRSDKIRALLKH